MFTVKITYNEVLEKYYIKLNLIYQKKKKMKAALAIAIIIICNVT